MMKDIRLRKKKNSVLSKRRGKKTEKNGGEFLFEQKYWKDIVVVNHLGLRDNY